LDEIVHLLGLEDKLKNMPNNLSGGQQQRVAIARACMLQPSVLCFDEPTSALDVESIASVTSIIKDLSKEMAILIITHDEGFAKQVGTRVV
ncbi:ATP-binding cassette domain-containing protein, partial [Streptococcus gordonii]|uniref:ATP-binding cassette domain-containing protein n=1 Tax=Streptococcus gordonii TaxID=1302 RepID=UPI001D0693E1